MVLVLQVQYRQTKKSKEKMDSIEQRLGALLEEKNRSGRKEVVIFP